MADTIREQIIDAIADRLTDFTWTAITTPSIFIGRSIFDPEVDEMPLVTMLAGQEDSERTRYGIDSITMPVSVSCLISLEDGAAVDSIAEPVFGEMKEALFAGGPIDLGFEDSGEEVEAFPFVYAGGGLVDYPSELGPAIINITISAVVKYETATGDPYN
jgi:hypothetical protein